MQGIGCRSVHEQKERILISQLWIERRQAHMPVEPNGRSFNLISVGFYLITALN